MRHNLILTVKESIGYWICNAKLGRKVVVSTVGLTKDAAMSAMIKELAAVGKQVTV